jgi:hypothetical protein
MMNFSCLFFFYVISSVLCIYVGIYQALLFNICALLQEVLDFFIILDAFESRTCMFVCGHFMMASKFVIAVINDAKSIVTGTQTLHEPPYDIRRHRRTVEKIPPGWLKNSALLCIFYPLILSILYPESRGSIYYREKY